MHLHIKTTLLKDTCLGQALIFIAMILTIACSEDDGPAACNSDFAVVVNQLTTSACGGATGSITVASSNGNGVVQYKINNGAFAEATTFSNLTAGVYTILAQDESNCEASVTVNVNNNSDLSFTAGAEDVSGCGGSGGSISFNASGGAGDYTYGILGQSVTSQEPLISGLAQGDYVVQVTDSDGCIVFDNVQVSSGISFSTDINAIVQTNCAVTGCHVTGEQAPDFSKKENILQNANRIQIRTGNRSMPPTTANTTLTNSEIALIKCWAEDGGPDN